MIGTFGSEGLREGCDLGLLVRLPPELKFPNHRAVRSTMRSTSGPEAASGAATKPAIECDQGADGVIEKLGLAPPMQSLGKPGRTTPLPRAAATLRQR
jgi:hypothetical protein